MLRQGDLDARAVALSLQCRSDDVRESCASRDAYQSAGTQWARSSRFGRTAAGVRAKGKRKESAQPSTRTQGNLAFWELERQYSGKGTCLARG